MKYRIWREQKETEKEIHYQRHTHEHWHESKEIRQKSCVSLGLGARHRTNGKNFINFEAVVYGELHRPLHMTTFMTSNSGEKKERAGEQDTHTERESQNNNKKSTNFSTPSQRHKHKHSHTHKWPQKLGHNKGKIIWIFDFLTWHNCEYLSITQHVPVYPKVAAETFFLSLFSALFFPLSSSSSTWKRYIFEVARANKFRILVLLSLAKSISIECTRSDGAHEPSMRANSAVVIANRNQCRKRKYSAAKEILSEDSTNIAEIC